MQKDANTRNETRTVMILTRTDVSLFWNTIISGISTHLSCAGLNAAIQFANEEKDEHWFSPLNTGAGLSGILVLSVYSDRFLRRYLDLNVPMVFLDTGITDSDRAFLRGDCVFSEGFYATESLTRHLIAQGMKKIGFIGDVTYCRTIRDRYDGYLLGLKSSDIIPDGGIAAIKSVPGRYCLKFEVEEALAGFKYIPEAVVCANDDIAMHLIKCLNDKEIRVPEDVAVTGYDNLESLIGHLPPFLSTVNVKYFDLGKRLARQLLWRMENPHESKEIIVVRTDVLIRGSSAKFPCFAAAPLDP